MTFVILPLPTTLFRAAKILLTVKILIFFTAVVWADTTTATIDIYADEMFYIQDEDKMIAKGNVEIIFEDMFLKADYIEYDRKKSSVFSRGNIDIKREKYSLTAAEFTYCFRTSTGVVYNAFIKAEPVYVHADKIIIKGDDEFFIPSGDITTCGCIPPHYKFTGKNINLKLGSRFSLFNTLLYIRGLPCFYYPYYFKNLGPERLKIDLDAGGSDRDGLFIRSKFSYPFTEKSRTYIGVDFMTKRGLGFKSGHKYARDDGFADLTAYYNRDRISMADRGNIYLKGRQKIYNNLNMNYRTEWTSDFEFNYHYGQRVYEYKQREHYYQMGIEYIHPWYIVLVDGNRKDIWEDDKYTVKDFVLPGISFNLLPVKLPGRLNFSGSSRYKNQYIPLSKEWVSELNMDSRLVGAYRLDIGKGYYITASPGLGYDGVLKEQFLFDDYFSIFTGLKQGIFNILFIDSDYKWRRKIRSPYTLTESLMNLEATVRPVRGFLLSSKTSYNLIPEAVDRIGDFFSTARIDFLRYSVFIRNRYDYNRRFSWEWLYEFNISDYSQTRVKYNYLFKDRLELEQKWTMRIKPFSIDLGVRFYIEEDKRFYQFDRFIEQSASINWDMHCWQSQFRIRKRGEEIELWVIFNLTAFPQRRFGLYGNLLHDDIRYHRE